MRAVQALTHPRSLVLALLAALPLAHCGADAAPGGLQATPPGTGPGVVFDAKRRPLPEIPQPNDVATFPDPTSRTGRRINASMVAPTAMERTTRAMFDEMEGWGTFAPATVAFTPSAGADPHAAAIDLDDVRRRMQGDSWSFADDPVYIVNLTTGVPVPLDMGNGAFPATVVDTGQYYPNDTRAAEQNVLFETAEEGAGLTQADYTPSLDTDFDGILDHPNTLGPGGKWPGVDNLMTWYERETDTLIMRPMLPMEEKTEYAVVLTDRLRGPGGQPVRSPFPYVHHPEQIASVGRLRDLLNDGARANYYGDLAGTGLRHVAFAWTFTTQPTVEDMRLLRDGLYGKGPFARFATEFPAKVTLYPTAGMALNAQDAPSGWQSSAACAEPSQTPFIARWSDAKPAIAPFLQQLFPLSDTSLRGLESSLDAVDYFVVGQFDSPFMMGDPASPDPNQHIHANFKTGAADVHRDKVHFWISIPKTTSAAKPPFPVAFWQHGTTVHDTEMFIHAGRYARQGVALVGYDAPGHGLSLNAGEKFLLQALLAQACLVPFTTAIGSGRAIDLNGDGTPDTGGLIWSAHVMHTRDGVRQAVLDGMQMTRILKSFDGTARSDQDYNGDGAPDLAGDFNGDGVVDLGGPSNRYFASGGSLGGIIAMVLGAVDSSFTATAPVSGAGGLVDVNTRGRVTPVPVLEQVLGPLVIAVPAASRTDTQCKPPQSSVRWFVNDLFASKEIEIACLDQTELAEQMTVVVTNETSREKRCARTGAGGAFRVALPTTVGDAIAIDVFTAPDVVDSYKTCNVASGAPSGRSIWTWEQPATTYSAVATDGLTCSAPNGCAQFRESFFPVGSNLVAPQEGVGLQRQTPEFRRLMNLSQAAVDPADPVNFAALYMLRALPAPDGSIPAPRPVLDVATAGDDQVLTATSYVFSRASGALPFLPPSAMATMPELADYVTPQALYDAWGGRTPSQVLIDTYQTEGIPRLARKPGVSCGVNYTSSATCTKPPSPDGALCLDTLYDADWLGESQEDYGQQHAAPLLRLARLAGSRATDPPSLAGAWSPRITGAPFAADDTYLPNLPLVGLVTAYIEPGGHHDWAVGEPCQAWDSMTYMDNLLARYFVTSGQDLYYLSHPASHACLANTSCAWLQ